MTRAALIAVSHDPCTVKESFRMTKSDLRAKPLFHH